MVKSSCHFNINLDTTRFLMIRLIRFQGYPPARREIFPFCEIGWLFQNFNRTTSTTISVKQLRFVN